MANIPPKRCIQCAYTGQMKLWLENYILPKFIACLGLFPFIIPGAVFIAWSWGKYKCPECGALQVKWLLTLRIFLRSQLFAFLCRLFVFLCVLLVGGLFVVIAGFGCTGGAAGTSASNIITGTCSAIFVVIYIVMIFHFAKWTFKKQIRKT